MELRPEVSDSTLLKAIEALTVNVGRRIEEKGRGAYVSSHEALGVVTEEYIEFVEAVTSNDPISVASEAMDIAVGCLFTVASMMEREEQLKNAQANLEKKVAEARETLEEVNA